MNDRSLIATFTTLRIIQILLVLITVFLEVVEYVLFNQSYEKEGFPRSAYFSAKITKSTTDESRVYYNGVKIFSYIVILISLTDAGIYLRHCSYSGPTKRDIFISAFFKTLWLIYSIANVYPEFKGYKFNCDSTAAIRRECNVKATIISIGWINTILFSATALIALVLWRRRREVYKGERRMRALGGVVYKYQPRPNTTVRINKPDQVMIFDKEDKKKTKRYASYFPSVSQADSSVQIENAMYS